MNQTLILMPLTGMFLLTLAVFMVMFYRRISEIRATGVTPQNRADMDKLSPGAVQAANNFQNLFELPVIFYAVVLALYVTHQVDQLSVICAYGFLSFRIIHSVIHCTYNHIMQRFSVYAVASVFLWIMVIRLALTLASGFNA